MAALSPKKRQRIRPKYARSEIIAAWLFLLPSLIGFIAFYAVPAVRGLMISFTDLNPAAADVIPDANARVNATFDQ